MYNRLSVPSQALTFGSFSGIPDFIDTDDDNDGIPDHKDTDRDGNGVPDDKEDRNKNGIPDHMELADSDGDGVPDVVGKLSASLLIHCCFIQVGLNI